MVQLISKTKAEGILLNYYDLLTRTGYVKGGMVKKLLLYVFLVDMVEYLHAFINEDDYRVIGAALAKLFSGGNCLLPYPVFCSRRATLGLADYMGDFIVRVTEDALGNDRRITEDDIIRIA